MGKILAAFIFISLVFVSTPGIMLAQTSCTGCDAERTQCLATCQNNVEAPLSKEEEGYKIVYECFQQCGYSENGASGGHCWGDCVTSRYGGYPPSNILVRAYENYKKGINPPQNQYMTQTDQACVANCQSAKQTCDARCAVDTQNNTPDNNTTNTTVPDTINNQTPDLPHNFTWPIDNSLSGGLARQFDEIFWRAMKFPPKIQDEKGDEISDSDAQTRLKNGNTVHIETKIENVGANVNVGIEMPPGLPVKKALFATAGPVTYADNQITIFSGNTIPNILRDGTITPYTYDNRGDGGPIESTPVQMPDAKQYDMGQYVNIETFENSQNTHPFNNAMFELEPPIAVGNPYLLRYDPDKNQWLELTTEEKCEEIPDQYKGEVCRVIAYSPGTSLFAIVTKKNTFKLSYAMTSLGFLGSIIYFVIVWLWRKFRKKKENEKHAGEQVCRFCQTSISAAATRCPHCAGDLRQWHMRYPVIIIIIYTLLGMIVGSILDSSPDSIPAFIIGGISGLISTLILYKFGIFKKRVTKKAT